MNPEEIINWFDSQDIAGDYIFIPEEIYKEIDSEIAMLIVEHFGGRMLIKLPQQEIDFFEWLKIEDAAVWDDLWSDTDAEPYVVSLSLLPVIIDKQIGFPICDLLNNDNYFFTQDHIEGTEANLYVESIRTMFMDKKKITLPQSLLLNISIMPTDIWHFAYNNRVNINKVKSAVQELVEEKLLIHLTSAEHLASFIKF